jgi:hypothetical protein
LRKGKSLSDYLEGADSKGWLKAVNVKDRKGLASLLQHIKKEELKEYFNPGTESGSTPEKRLLMFIKALKQVSFGPHYDHCLSSSFLVTTALIINENISVQSKWRMLWKAVYTVMVGLEKKTNKGDIKVMACTAKPLLQCLKAIHTRDPPELLEKLISVDEDLGATITWSTQTADFSRGFEDLLVIALNDCLEAELKESTSACTDDRLLVPPLPRNKKLQKALINVIKSRLKNAASAAARLLATWYIYPLDNSGQDPAESRIRRLRSLSTDLQGENLDEFLIDMLPKRAKRSYDMDGIQSALNLLVSMLAGDVTLFDDYSALPSLLLLSSPLKKPGGVNDIWTNILASTLVVHVIESPRRRGRLDTACIDDIVDLCHYLLTSGYAKEKVFIPRMIYVGVRLSRFVEKLDEVDRDRICQRLRGTVSADLLDCLHCLQRFKDLGTCCTILVADGTQSPIKVPGEIERIGWSTSAGFEGCGQNWSVLQSRGAFKSEDFLAQVFSTLSTYNSLPLGDDKDGKKNDSRAVLRVEKFLEGQWKLLLSGKRESMNLSALEEASTYLLTRKERRRDEPGDDQPFEKKPWVTELFARSIEWVGTRILQTLEPLKNISLSLDSTDPESIRLANQFSDLAMFNFRLNFKTQPEAKPENCRVEEELLLIVSLVTLAQGGDMGSEYVDGGAFQDKDFQRLMTPLQQQVRLHTRQNKVSEAAQFNDYKSLLTGLEQFFAFQCFGLCFGLLPTFCHA